MAKKSEEGLTVKKAEDFSEWYSQVLDKAEITDLRYGVKGFVVIRPWGARILENMYKHFEDELQKKGHEPTFFPTVIPEENFKKEASHVEGFTPEVFWLEQKQGDERLALRPTSETAMYQMYSLWIRSHRDLPLKIYQRGNVFRYETKATRPLIRAREFLWIEAHDCFETKEEAEAQVQEDIGITETVMHQKFGVPFFPMKRPAWDRFAGAEYTVGSDCLMPDGKFIQQPSTHLLGQHFSKAFDVTFKDKNEQTKHVWQTCYGPAPSRILASIISTHGDDSGLVLPFSITPIQTVIVPIFRKDNKEKVLAGIEKIKTTLEEEGIKTNVDLRDKRPGEKYYEWELKGVPFRLDIGENEIKGKELTLFTRNTKKKTKLLTKNLKTIKELGIKYDKELLAAADKGLKGKTKDCKTIEEIKKTIENKKIARVNFCSIEEDGNACAEVVEKKVKAFIRGTMADKNEKPVGNCPVCNKKATAVVYIGRSY
jgi:prolyl-tRNA synthetase